MLPTHTAVKFSRFCTLTRPAFGGISTPAKPHLSCSSLSFLLLLTADTWTADDEGEGEDASEGSGGDEAGSEVDGEEEDEDAAAAGGGGSQRKLHGGGGLSRQRKQGGGGGSARRGDVDIVQISKRTSKASRQELETLDGPEDLPNMKPMMELEAGKNVWYQAYVLKESLNEAKVRFPRA